MWILSPAGSPDALFAALEAGADEVYFGIGSLNARAGAKNFTREEAAAALRECRLRGVHAHITLNTLVTDRELPEALDTAYFAASHGADAFIVQDLGLADALRTVLPGFPLHASTQCAVHNAAGARFLAEHGFSRIVLARELPETDIRTVASLGVETEIFVHGALCVCHSGMCLMSSVIGGRSGNRGMCAQPCRLPYEIDGSGRASGRYPLSLKDLSLAKHIPALAASGVTSLKIEGRMKDPAYVADVTRVWKTLITENRNATDEEYTLLEKRFSRGGFTDGYFTGAFRNDNRAMYGVRSDEDKAESRHLANTSGGSAVKRPVKLSARFAEGECPTVTLTDGVRTVSTRGDAPLAASQTRPLTREDAASALAKFGGTPFICTELTVDLAGRVFAPRSVLNTLRRSAVAALEDAIMTINLPPLDLSPFSPPKKINRIPKTEKRRLIAASTHGAKKLLALFPENDSVESVCLPLGAFRDGKPDILDTIAARGLAFGVRLPRVVFTSEEPACVSLLKNARDSGAAYALAENIGHLPLIKAAGLPFYAGFALNVFNSRTAAFFAREGAYSVTLSPELLPAQMRDIDRPAAATIAVAAAGDLELMVLESCPVRANGHCRATPDGNPCAVLRDRVGAKFPLRAERRLTGDGFPCRTVLLNGVPLPLFSHPEKRAQIAADVLCIYESFGEDRP